MSFPVGIVLLVSLFAAPAIIANCLSDADEQRSCFRAAVFEHNRLDSVNCSESVAKNLQIYEKVAKIARENGANIIVFPEDGIFAGSKSTVLPCLEEIPNPNEQTSGESVEGQTNFCSLKPKENKLKIMTKLSCIAEENQLYVVANFGTRQACRPHSLVGEQICPQRGFFMLNTNIVFDPNGNFVRRYRKYNTFVEIFDKAPELEFVDFETPFGKFGVFTCFDIMFKEPALDLVEVHQIDSVVFPTWWFDSVPLLTATQFQDAWSWRNKVNLLAANILQPSRGSTGSGIYSVDNSSAYVGISNRKPTLIVKELPSSRAAAGSCNGAPPMKIALEEVEGSEYVPNAHNTLLQEDLVYKIDKNNKDDVTICHKEICCHLVYELEIQSAPLAETNKLILMIRDGPRPRRKFHEQFCALATTTSEIHLSNLSDAKFDLWASSNFVQLSLTASFSSEYIFPIASHNVSALIERSDREFSCEKEDANRTSCKHSLHSQRAQPVNSFGLYARYFDGDIR